MATQTTNRLGDILISKGLITPEQLNIAINEQKKRRQQLAPLDAAQAAPLGEILIELGFINRMQLKRGLGWQSVVRKVTLAMSLCAPLLTISYEAAAAPVTVVSSSSSSKSSGSAIPLTIQAENYDSMVGVQTESTSDTGGGLNVGYIDANDSMSYSSSGVIIPVTGSYKITYRVAAAAAGGSFTLSEGSTVYDTVTVPKTGDYQKWVDVERTITLTKGTHSFNIKAITGGFNINWFKIDSAGATLPQTIEAEAYASMSGVQIETTSDTGGGMNVGYIDAKDSMSYTSNPINIPTSGTYQLTYRVASGSGGGQFTFNEADTTTVYDTVTVPGTGGWQTWTTVTRTVTLSAGTHRFGLVAVSGAFNINWFKIEKPASSSSSQASSVASSKASSVASSTAVGTTSSVKASSSSSAAPVISSSAAPVVSSSASSKPTTTASSSAATVSSSSAASSAASAQALPLTIKADSYSTMSGIQTEATSDTGGGNNVGYIDSSDWLNFANTSVNIPKTGTYKVSYRVASETGGGTLNLNEAGSSVAYDTVSVPSTGGWQAWTTVERTVTLTAGVHKFGVTATTGGFNLNWIKIEEIIPPLDQTIEAESYTTMSGVQTEATSDTGGGLNVGYIDTNDWMSYSGTSVKVPVTGSYKVTYRVASETGGGSFSLLESATGVSYDTVSVANTGGWQKWVLIERTITLTAGTHAFDIKALSGGFNINWFKISSLDSSTSVSSSSTATSTNSSSTPATVSSSSKASISSSSSSATSTTNSNGVVTTQVAGPVGMSWIAPNKRQNGSVLDITEVAGYEIRYKLANSENFTYISINDAWTNTYNFSWLEGNYVFQIAAFDKNGLYSEFVDVIRR